MTSGMLIGSQAVGRHSLIGRAQSETCRVLQTSDLTGSDVFVDVVIGGSKDEGQAASVRSWMLMLDY